MDLDGKWALVTGAARRIGKAIAARLAAAGANLVVHYGTSSEAAEETVAELRSTGVEALALQADLARPAEIEELFGAVERRCGGLAVLVNSAASFERRPLAETTAADWDRVQAVNLRAPFLCLREAARLMVSGERGAPGVIVNIADLSGLQAWAGYGAHGVSKAGVIHLTRVAAKELAPAVRVNCVVPGAILPPPGASADDPGWRAKIERVPLQRHGEPAGVAEAVLFLVASEFATGVVLPLDGGEHLVGARPMT